MKLQSRLKYNLKVKALKGLIQQIKWQGVNLTQDDLGDIDLKLETTDQDEYLEQIALINAKLEDLRDFLNDRKSEQARDSQADESESRFSLNYYLQDC